MQFLIIVGTRSEIFMKLFLEVAFFLLLFLSLYLKIVLASQIVFPHIIKCHVLDKHKTNAAMIVACGKTLPFPFFDNTQFCLHLFN